jgi:hypothetical protein
MYLKLMLKNKKMSTCDRLDSDTLESRLSTGNVQKISWEDTHEYTIMSLSLSLSLYTRFAGQPCRVVINLTNNLSAAFGRSGDF